MVLYIRTFFLAVIVFMSFTVSAASALPLNTRPEIKNRRDTVPENDTSLISFHKVEVEASYPGGDKAWLNFLVQNLNAGIAAKKNAPVGVYTVVVQFIVDKDGAVSDITPLTNHGYGMEEEVVRVIRKSPRWKCAVQDGRKVRAYRKQPVTFQVSEEEKKKKKRSKDD
jgi:Gram-negative bacterial TonB protein C-terminal